MAVLKKAAEESETPAKFKKVKTADLQKSATLKGFRPITIDIAMFGRMITSEAFRDVEASVQVAHALSTNKLDHEFDYFTAVDDLKDLNEDDDMGADMIGDIEFNSSCYYKYFSVDWDGLVSNLAGPNADDSQKQVAREIARKAIPAFLNAAVHTTPSGKQNTFAAHQLPDAILIEVRPVNTPVSYANAFLKPSRATAKQDLMDVSLSQFKEHVETLTHKFGLKTDQRLWFCTRENEKIAHTQWTDTLDDLLKRLSDKLAEGKEGQHVSLLDSST